MEDDWGISLMKEIHALSDGHPRSIGVALDTENAVNVPFYEHYGYAVVVKTELEGMDLWSLFRKNQGRGR